MKKNQHNRLFGKQKEEHLLILASGDNVRHMTFRPWMAVGAISMAAILFVSYLLATSYLVLRDDLIGATMARQARMQYDYEDRISALRAQVDRITSRQLLDQQLVEDKVDKLIEQQEALTARAGKLTAAFSQSSSSSPKNENIPAASQEKQSSLSLDGLKNIIPLGSKQGENVSASQTSTSQNETVGDRSDRLFTHMTLSLKAVEDDQRAKLASMAQAAGSAADTISAVIGRFNLPLPNASEDADPVGGPFIEAQTGDDFGLSLSQLDLALDRFERARALVNATPFANPAVGKEITSPFGNRRDPFLGRLALHSGIDFRFAPGEPVRPTAPGRVTVAGWTGGYGNMVEVEHGNGIVTRYGHLAQILVKLGDTVGRNTAIGLAGSTGRSTGTHLHYEIRENGSPVDPIYFINAGLKLNKYIE
ncbi:M23 family metallopeptidase [Oryzifoliimicrobium ureilyticus]|uniref:M23 family metallopeptidase n=1 Tax=Oryzifoliimicrobium ureilyticus TaxID=3113724 RepID=UPI003F672010